MGLREAAVALTGRQNGDGQPVHEQLQAAQWDLELMRENFQRLEAELGDVGWRRINAQLQREFTRDGLTKLINISRTMYMVNPLIQRAVNVTGYYTWAQGVTIQAKDDKVQSEVVEPMMADEGNKAELFSHQARLLTDVDQMVDGNTFMRLPTDDDGNVLVRSIPTEEVLEILVDPADNTQVRFYRRNWTRRKLNEATGIVDEEPVTQYHPDYRHQPGTQSPGTINGHEVLWNEPIIHQRTGGLKQMRFGVPETYAAIDWARAYKKFLEDWHTIVSALARFAWKATVSGKRVEDSKDKLNTRRGATEGQEREFGDRKPPAPGGVFVSAGDELTPIPKTGATTSAEDAKPSRLMVGAAMNLPDNILSTDVQQGALATAKSLDRPTELGMLSRQQMWADHDQAIFNYAVQQKLRQGRVGRAANLEVDVTFAPILEHDQAESVGALVMAATLDGKADAGTIPRPVLAKALMEAVNIDDVEAALKDVNPEAQPEMQAITDAVETLREAIGARTD